MAETRTRIGWEHRYVAHSAAIGLVPKLDELGLEGWELVAAFQLHGGVGAILKRPIAVSEPIKPRPAAKKVAGKKRR